MTEKIVAQCLVENCNRKKRGRGWCSMHYKRWKRNGDPEKLIVYTPIECSVDGCTRISKSLGYCSLHYERLRINGNVFKLGTDKDMTDEERFWNLVQLTADDTRCWEWQGCKDPCGYGLFGMQRKRFLAHRLAWFFVNGKMPEDCLLHQCDNPSCVNPKHLMEGDRVENMRQKVVRGRQLRGEQMKQSKLTDEKVRLIRQRLKQGENQITIALDMNVSGVTICNVNKGHTWNHVV